MPKVQNVLACRYVLKLIPPTYAFSIAYFGTNGISSGKGNKNGEPTSEILKIIIVKWKNRTEYFIQRGISYERNNQK